MEKYSFLNFIKSNNIIDSAITTIISLEARVFSESFIDNICMPFLLIDKDGDGKADIKSLEKISVNLFGVKLKIGLFLIDFIKLLVILFIIYLFNILFK